MVIVYYKNAKPKQSKCFLGEMPKKLINSRGISSTYHYVVDMALMSHPGYNDTALFKWL